ncbi:FRG domain-containing protein [Streptococcus alactolyticus]|jgi:uncharacterized protein YbcI|uniref:FRG domain-containing protein n=1 Tax=Streptococcus alactolyticus TaxID=29389 RepID=UPI002804CEEB|nr:FRG domain-containing protein [uncultured Streptococcus sp.]MCI6904098.1 FRG domain-containing protein [Streptococcus alactolyticus]
MVCDNNKNFDNQIKGESVDSILKSILQHRRIRFDNLRKEKPDLSNDEIELIIKKEHFYFRGESSYHKFRTPSLYLQENLTMEGSEYYYRSLINELGRDDYQENTSLVRLISELQHYGAKTRMLDITKNPLIALYFAVEKDDDEPGFVFIYKSDIDNEKFDTGHTIAIKSALNLMSQEIIDNFLDAVTRNLSEDDIKKYELLSLSCIDKMELIEADYPNDDMSLIYNFMELLNQRARVRERLDFPLKIYKDLQESHIVLPSKTTDRIRQQQGAFIYPRYVSSTKKEHGEIQQEISDSISELSAELLTEKAPFSVIKIDCDKKKSIRNQLELIGITEGFVYPDIEHQSMTLLEQLNPQGKK